MSVEHSDFEDYQDLASRTARGDMEAEKRLCVAALGLAGEAGEVADIVKKIVGHGHEMSVAKLKDELGDTLWYVAEMCTVLNLSLRAVAYDNINKLKKRYPEGFSEERSRDRDNGWMMVPHHAQGWILARKDDPRYK